MGPSNGMPESVSAADAPLMAGTSCGAAGRSWKSIIGRFWHRWACGPLSPHRQPPPAHALRHCPLAILAVSVALSPARAILALSGGTGGAKLLDGLAQAAGQEALGAVVNTGDDADFYGLRVCPDLDICTYTLAGVSGAHRNSAMTTARAR